jgi:hypothetical protein
MPTTLSWKPATSLLARISIITGSLSSRGPMRSWLARLKRVLICVARQHSERMNHCSQKRFELLVATQTPQQSNALDANSGLVVR